MVLKLLCERQSDATMDDLFISYSRDDAPWADRLRLDLTSLGFSVFMDRTRLTAGEQWDKQLQSAIENSRNLVVLWSPQAAQSHWVTMEMAYFERARADDVTLTLNPYAPQVITNATIVSWLRNDVCQ